MVNSSNGSIVPTSLLMHNIGTHIIYYILHTLTQTIHTHSHLHITYKLTLTHYIHTPITHITYTLTFTYYTHTHYIHTHIYTVRTSKL